MEITNEMDQDIDISQPSSTTMDNNSSNPNNENKESSNDDSINEYRPVNNQMINSYSASNSCSFDQMNNKAMSNSRDDKDIYQSNQYYTPPRTSSMGNNEYSNSSDEENSTAPPPYEDLFPPPSTKKHIPGTTGLSNLGNTCFMNSGIQCIAHTNLLREYLLKGYWKKELNLTSIHGMKGKIVKAFVKVLENLWSDSDRAYRPTEFKSVISKHTPSFEGYHQHDCQEFIASLLDGLHEDINRVPVKKFEEYPDMNEMKDDEAAKTSWDLHIRRENSIIVDLFYGQYRSINICQTCETKRLNFEPFVYLTLPIPENQEIEIPVQVLSNGKYIDTVRINILKSQSIALMKEKICEKIKESIPDINITKDNLEIFEQSTREYSMNSCLSNNEQVDNISSIRNNNSFSMYNRPIFAYIVLNEFSIEPIRKYLPNSMEKISTNTNINIPVYQKVENADSYYSDDKGFPFFINLPKLSQFENEEKMIDRRFLGWIVYREIVKFYQQFTEYKIATQDPQAELDERVYEYLKQIKEEEETLNKNISTSMKPSSNDIDSDDDSVNDTGNGETNILNNDDELDSHQGNASSNNDASLSDVQINDNDNIEIDPEDVTPMNDDEDTVLENTNQAIQAKQSDAIVNDTVTTDIEMENREEDVENIYPINDGWKIMSKLFDVQLIYTDKINENFYSYYYNCNCPRIALYNPKDNSSKESEPYTYSYRSNYNTENRNEKIKLNPKDLLIMVTWKPDILKFLFGEKKFEIFAPNAPKQSIKRPEAKPISLEECIQEFIKDEILTDENKWFCPNCKEDREAYKKMDIWKAPEILIVHLKRFIQDKKYYNSYKNNVLVKYPIEGLDLTNVVIGPKDEEKYIYNLYAISSHSGSTSGGHYTAYVKNDGRWYDCNDSFVSEVSESSIVSSSAYLLFYERVHEPGKEFKLPDLDNVPDVIDEEEIKLQEQQKQRMQMSMGMPMQMGNTSSGMDSSNNSGNDSPPEYSPESFADFDNANSMFTSDGQNNGLMDMNNQSSLNNSSSDLNNSNNNDILYEGEM